MDDESYNPEDYGYGDSGYGFDTQQFYSPELDRSNEYLGWDDSGFEGWGDVPGAGSTTAVDASTGNITYQYDDGSSLTVGPDGNPIGSTESPDAKGNSVAYNRALMWANSNLGPTAGKVLANIMSNPGASLLTAVAAAKAFGGKDEVGGYNKPVPKMDVIQQRVAYDDTNRRPGEAGREYFTTPMFVAQGDAANAAAATAASQAQAQGIAAAAPRYAPPAANPWVGKTPINWNPARQAAMAAPSTLPVVPRADELNEQGGIKMATGGIADAGRYLQGRTDGMADKLPTSIDGEQPAALSHGEFVIPADVVSHLGNGNSDAGADKLYQMMSRIRKARTGNSKQGKQINPDKFMPGGLATAYAAGGEVKGYAGTEGSLVGGGVPLDTSKTSTLSPWVGDYVTNALGQGAALASQPYQSYTGPLTAGASNLQQQAFAGASDIAAAGYQPGQFTGGFNASMASQYMNPYLQASLDPQLKELQRQADIQRTADAGRLTQAGAFGGSRQAIMESEGRRNLLDKQAGLLGTGYKTAYDTGLGQFNKERAAEEESRQFGANYGLKSIQSLADMGATQRGITGEGLAADKAQFEAERDFAYKMPQYQLGLLSGLPIGSSTASTATNPMSTISGLGSLYQQLSNLGQAPK